MALVRPDRPMSRLKWPPTKQFPRIWRRVTCQHVEFLVQVLRLLDSYLTAWTMDKVTMHSVYRWYPASPCRFSIDSISILLHLPGSTLVSQITISRYVFRIEVEIRENANTECRISHSLYPMHCTTLEKWFPNRVCTCYQRNYAWHSKASVSRLSYHVWVLTCCTLPIIDQQFSVWIGVWAHLLAEWFSNQQSGLS